MALIKDFFGEVSGKRELINTTSYGREKRNNNESR
jgi:hypothetical protein